MGLNHSCGIRSGASGKPGAFALAKGQMGNVQSRKVLFKISVLFRPPTAARRYQVTRARLFASGAPTQEVPPKPLTPNLLCHRRRCVWRTRGRCISIAGCLSSRGPWGRQVLGCVRTMKIFVRSRRETAAA
jgi:hypothetical protein